MPPLPVVPGVVKIILGGTYHDARWLNIFHMGYTGAAPDATTLGDYLTSTVMPAAVVAYAAEMSVDNELTSGEVTDLASDTGASVSISASTHGVRSGDFMPASVALVISREINRRYRGGHPRSYLPWGTAGTMATGSTIDWDPDFLTDCGEKFGTMITSWSGGAFGSTTITVPVNVSYRSGGAPRTTAVVDPITSSIARQRICSQRRRLGKIGG